MTVWGAPVSGSETNGTSTHLRVLVAVLAGAFLIRVIALGAFPEITADEGLWTNSSKNFVRFGDWFMDLRTHVFLSPVFHGATTAVFWLFHPSIAAARGVSALAGSVSVLLMYMLAWRATERRDLALAAAVLFGFDVLGVILSRRALIESLQLCLVLLSATLLIRARGAGVAGAAVVFGAALLAKLNAAFVLPVLGVLLLWRSADSGWRPTLAGWRDTLLFAGVSVGVAGLAYWALFASHPEEFVRAFRFELDRAAFAASSNAVVRAGRFGLDPIHSSRTVLGLFRESPFFMVLAACGAAIALVGRPRGAALFGPWLVLGMAFFLGQMFQPIRYFHLLSPAFAFFGAVAVQSLGPAEAGRSEHGRWVRTAVLGMYLAFNVAYVGVGAFANRAGKLQQVVAWARTSTDRNDRIMAAGYFCTDLPNRAYAYYHLARDTTHLLESLRTYRIDYVIYDSAEWRPALGEALKARFPIVKQWPFGVVYRVTPAFPSAGADSLTATLEAHPGDSAFLEPRGATRRRSPARAGPRRVAARTIPLLPALSRVAHLHAGVQRHARAARLTRR